MPVEEQLATIFEVIEGGVETTAEVIPFPVDAGATALEGTTTTVQLGNGIATEVSQLTVTEAGATTTAGVGLLAMDVGAVGLAIAPALGILAGVGLYSLAPEFWTNVSNALVNAGQTVGGKVRAFINGNSKTVGFSEETIEIFKNAFRDAGLFETSVTPPDNAEELKPSGYDNIILTNPLVHGGNDVLTVSRNWTFRFIANPSNVKSCFTWVSEDGYNLFFVSSEPFTVNRYYNPSGTGNPDVGTSEHTTFNNKDIYYLCYKSTAQSQQTVPFDSILYSGSLVYYRMTDIIKWVLYCLLYGNISGVVQPDAILPDANPFPTKYPEWTPWTLPDETTKVYPIEIPEINPDALQDDAQNPDALPDDNPNLLPWFITNLPQPTPNPDPYPEPSIEPDPDPQPEPDPIENPTEPDTDPNPVDPNPDPSLPALPIVPDIPDTVPANAMFTVYKPTIAQVNAFGSWLWSNNIMEAIKRIWQNPLDGIISFMKVYVDAPTSGSDTIKVGMLDSEVSSAVVTGQFVTVECGSINIREKFYNATDYSPFVSLHVYLPFIGIVELDIDEFMNGEIKITYHVDVYTGTCLAEIKARRSYDKPEWTIIYTFSGNASQQLPLTSASFSGALSSLVSIVGGGLAIASGGGLGLLAGATGLAHAVTHEMVHLAHSGSLSANAGIMGARKPFLILTRRRSYDANGYNELYGYPSNKTVFLNNCSGFVKVKDIQLKTSATDVENKEIETHLKNGVII